MSGTDALVSRNGTPETLLVSGVMLDHLSGGIQLYERYLQPKLFKG